MIKRSLGKIFFVVAIFGTFRRYVTNLRGTLLENVKKVQNQPTLLYIVQHPLICIAHGSVHNMDNVFRLVACFYVEEYFVRLACSATPPPPAPPTQAEVKL
jgi:hypothetical protein